MSALTIVQRACSRLGITSPSAVFSSTDDQIVQLRHLMNQEGDELARAHSWTKLITEKTFTTVAQAVQTSAVPSDFNYILSDTLWNRNTDIKGRGPVSAEEWQAQQALGLGALPDFIWRIRGSDLLIYPSPTAGQTCAYEYVSINWMETSGGVDGSAMTADTDVALLDERLIVLGVIWRFLAAKGLDYSEALRTYQMEVAKAIGRDGGRQKHYLGGRSRSPFNANIPESGWNL